MRPRGDPFADPAASVVWAAISALPEIDKHKLYDHLPAHLQISAHGRSPSEQRVAPSSGRCLAAAPTWPLSTPFGTAPASPSSS